MAEEIKKLSSIEVENRNKKKEFRNLFFIALAGLVCFFGIWELIVRLGLIELRYLNPPSMVVSTFFRKLVDPTPEGSTIPQHFWASFRLALCGFIIAVIIGIPLGWIMGYYKTANRLIRPL